MIMNEFKVKKYYATKMMKKIILLIIALIPINVYPSIYRTNIDNGIVLFSDKPSENAEKIILKQPNIYEEAIPSKHSKNAPQGPTIQADFDQTLSIRAPRNNESFKNDEHISMEIVTRQKLQEGDKLFVSIDGQTREVNEGVLLKDLDRGKHHIIAWVSNQGGAKIASSEEITFFAGRTFSLGIKMVM
jgi:hypothetical protein